jgi:hypothetical protein
VGCGLLTGAAVVGQVQVQKARLHSIIVHARGGGRVARGGEERREKDSSEYLGWRAYEWTAGNSPSWVMERVGAAPAPAPPGGTGCERDGTLMRAWEPLEDLARCP